MKERGPAVGKMLGGGLGALRAHGLDVQADKLAVAAVVRLGQHTDLVERAAQIG